MNILKKVAEVRELLDGARAQGKSIGFMGTSGAMHNGHLSLVRRAVEENDLAIMFWGGALKFSWAPEAPRLYNPDQSRDLTVCEAAGMKHAYVPDGDDYMARPPVTVTLVPQLSTGCPRMEDPSHLNRVSCATAKLFNIFGRVRYYSGEKDWQQLAMFKRMAEDLSTEVEIIGCPVIREPDGLALSSRNVKLTIEERERAPTLYAALCDGAAAIARGERSSKMIERLIRDRLEAVGEALYVNCVDANALQPLEQLKGDIRLIASLKLGIVPLVDNVGVRID
jgi:pantoate--beta-alanine ligase